MSDTAASADRIVDCDVHVAPMAGIQSLLPYMTRAWQARIAGLGPLRAEPRRHPLPPPEPAVPLPCGSDPPTDPAVLVEHLLAARGIGRALLIPIPWVNAFTDARIATAYVAAFNDHFVHDWLPADRRLALAISVSPHDPEAAAAEIRRHAPTGGVVAVTLPLLNILPGHRFYFPIYAAAAEAGLPVIFHPTGAEGIYHGAPEHAGGVAASYPERDAANAGLAQSLLNNVVIEGLFEHFPGLTVVFAEWGFTWLPPLLWKMDLQWTRLRIDIPWLKRPASEYVYDHVRFTTQPTEEEIPAEQLRQIVEMIRGERTLLFGSDFPHWDFNDPFRLLENVPEATRRAICWENPMALFGARWER